MIKPPSNQRPFDVFYAGDPAIVSLPPGASEKQQADHDRCIERALETGDWSKVVVPGEQPTRFSFRPLSAEEAGELRAMFATERPFRVYALAFRIAISGVNNLPDAGEIDLGGVHPVFGRIATTAFLDRAGLKGDIGAAIIVELGSYVLKRARGDDPKF